MTDIEEDEQSRSQSNGQPKRVNDGVSALLSYVADREEEVV